MELDSFLTSPRWEMIQIISNKPSSPIEIAQQLKTSVSFVSQQLKLLEAAGIVQKKRTGASEKGKPRTIFSLAKESVYIILLSEGISDKKLVPIDEHHKIILRIWLIEGFSYHYQIEKFFWKIEEFLQEITAIFVDTTKVAPKMIILSENKALRQKIDTVVKKLDSEISFEVVTELSSLKLSSTFIYPIYDPNHIFQKRKAKEVKGGIENNNE